MKLDELEDFTHFMQHFLKLGFHWIERPWKNDETSEEIIILKGYESMSQQS